MIATRHDSIRNGLRCLTGRDDRRNAFALLMVIACLTLIILALVGATRRSLLLALESRNTIDTLHRRWSEITLERAGLAAGIEIYGKHPSSNLASEDHPHHHQYELPVRLNQQRYRLLIADESSKANLSTLLRYKTSEEARAVANELSNYQMRDLTLPPRRGKVAFSGDTGRNQPSIQSWGDVLPIGSEGPDQWPLGELPEHTQRLTVWGDGKVNIYRAPDEVLFEVSRLIISDSFSRQWIEKHRRTAGKIPLPRLLSELGIDFRQQTALERLYQPYSSCLSVRLISIDRPGELSICIATRAGASNRWSVDTKRYGP